LQALAAADCSQRAALLAQAKADFATWKADWGKPAVARTKVRQDVLALLQKMQALKAAINQGGTATTPSQ
jgi:hypothetical protein